MDWSQLYAEYGGGLEDFWGRRESKATVEHSIRLFGRSIMLKSNHECVVEAIEGIRELFAVEPNDEASRGSISQQPFEIQTVVCVAAGDPGPVPDDLDNYIIRAGEGSWICLQAGIWGVAFADLERGWGRLILTPELARRPDLIGARLLSTIILNLFIGGGAGMLHASCLERGDRVLLLMAPHNTGKSTTALHLLLRQRFVLHTDSMLFLFDAPEDLVHLFGFPVGRIKLREDSMREAVAIEPQLERVAEPEFVRAELKHNLDLRRYDASLVRTEALTNVENLELCLLDRTNREATGLRPAETDAVMNSIFHNSLYYDSPEVWSGNLNLLRRLVERSTCHHLSIGTRIDGIVEAVNELMSQA